MSVVIVGHESGKVWTKKCQTIWILPRLPTRYAITETVELLGVPGHFEIAVEPDDLQLKKFAWEAAASRCDLVACALGNLDRANTGITHSCGTLCQTIDNGEPDSADIRKRALLGHEHLSTHASAALWSDGLLQEGKQSK